MLPDGYAIRPLSVEDAGAVARAYERNRDHLGPWDPIRPPAYYTEEGQQGFLAEQLHKRDLGLLRSWVITHEASPGEIVGRANLQNIVRGSMQGGTLGYWVDAEHVRRGLARAAVEHVVVAAADLGLHRVDAATMIANTPSQRVLERCGFVRYGLAPQFLFIAGAWEDHVLFQRVLHQRPLR